MAPSSSTIVMIVAIAVTVIAIVVYFIKNKAAEYTFAPSMSALSASEMVISSDKVKSILRDDSFTLSMYAFVSAVNRTPTFEAVSTRPLLAIKDAFSFEIGPGEARAIVTTIDETGSRAKETFQLPIFPQQKWIYLTILRSGRKFDVMYNDEIVASHTLKATPIYTSSPLIIGDKSVIGTYIHGNMISARRSKADVISMHSRTSDTRGQPTESLMIHIKNLFKVKVPSFCPPGVSCDTVSTVASPGLTNAWDSPYA
jgi:hypothetical protein